MVIDTPGVYALDFEDYLRDPVPGGSLSHSGARILLEQTPAAYAYERDHPRPPTDAFDLGHAAHHAVLGDGMEIAVIPDAALAKNGATNTNAAKEFIAEARARGAVPVKSDVGAQVDAMADALRRHPLASKILDPQRGKVEQSAFWLDEQYNLFRRARYDLMIEDGSRLTLVDYKSADDLSDRTLANSIGRYGYAQQDPWYCDGAKALGLDDDPRFLFVFQSKKPPYLVRVVELPEHWVEIGRKKNRRAIELYAECREADDWPAYPLEVEVIDPPAWVVFEDDEEMVF